MFTFRSNDSLSFHRRRTVLIKVFCLKTHYEQFFRWSVRQEEGGERNFTLHKNFHSNPIHVAWSVGIVPVQQINTKYLRMRVRALYISILCLYASDAVRLA